MNLQNYTKLPISDGEHGFPFLMDTNGVLYCPAYNPKALGKHVVYKLSLYRYVKGTNNRVLVNEYIITGDDFVAISPFRHEEHNYHQAFYTGLNLSSRVNSHYLYVELGVWNGDDFDSNYTVCQGAWITNVTDISIEAFIGDDVVYIKWFPETLRNIDGLKEYISYCYTGDIESEATITIVPELVIMGTDDVYWKSDTYEIKGNVSSFDINDMPFRSHEQWTDDLRMVGFLNIEIDNGGNIIHINIRSNQYQLTEEKFARLIHLAHPDGLPTMIDTTKMIVNKPRIVNKNIQQVVEMTTQSDSKSNIIQPVFFRTRELASLIIHPAVTENICINLDAYKSQVERFRIKLDGVVFNEIGRVESGIIFKIQGNMLPGKVPAGVYYILNQDGDLVTTGKYKYES